MGGFRHPAGVGRKALHRFPTGALVCTVAAIVEIASFVALLAAVPGASAYTPHAPIRIVSNGNFTAANGVTGGSGTPADPYIIEGWEIYPDSYGIDVENTDAFFTIRSTYVHSNVPWPDGITLWNVENATVGDTQIAGVRVGVYVSGSRNVLLERVNASRNSVGINVAGSENVTVTLSDASWNSYSGIDASACMDCTFSMNNATNNFAYGPSSAGINVWWGSARVTVADNNLTGNGVGLGIGGADRVTLARNRLSGNGIGARLYSSTNLTLTDNLLTGDGLLLDGYRPDHFDSHVIGLDNLVNGQPVRYARGCRDANLDGVPAGQVIFASCSRIRVANVDVAEGEVGLQMYYVDDAVATGNRFTKGSVAGAIVRYSTNVSLVANGAISNGIVVRDSQRIFLAGNNVSNILGDGIDVDHSSETSIVGNDISAAGEGVWVHFVPNAVIVQNSLSAGMGIGVTASAGATVAGNTVSGSNGISVEASDFVTLTQNALSSAGYGVSIYRGEGARVSGNRISAGQRGVYLDSTNGARIIRNNVTAGGDGMYIRLATRGFVVGNNVSDARRGIALEVSQNVFLFHNTLVNNTVQGYDYGYFNFWNASYPTGGNYWSDYTGVDQYRGPGQNQPGPDGIGDAPYGVDPDTRDRYPLIAPRFVPNEPPHALFTLDPRGGATNTTFAVSASGSWDAEDLPAMLLTRWDWEGDGLWDTPWSTDRTATHVYGVPGTFPLALEVRDSAGLTGRTWQNVTVVLLGPDYIPWLPKPQDPIRTGLSTSVSLSVEAFNQGNGTAPRGATLALYNESTPSTPFAVFPVPPLAAYSNSSRFATAWRAPAAVGTYRVVASVDSGNDLTEWDEANNLHVWTIEVVPGPITSLWIGQPNVTAPTLAVASATPIGFTILDQSGVGLQRTTYRVDNGPWTDYSAPRTFTVAGDGEHTIEWFSEDRAGNVEPVSAAVVRVDDTPPATALAIGDPSVRAAGTFIASSTRLTLGATDGGAAPVGVASIEYRIDGDVWTPYSGPFAVPGEGPHAIGFRSTDRLGNREPDRFLAVVVDDSPPVASPKVGAPSYRSSDTWVTSRTPIQVTAADGGPVPVGVDRVEYRVWSDGWSPWYAYGAPLQVTGDGRHYVEYRAADLLGNAASVANLTLLVDDTAPATVPAIGEPQAVAGQARFIIPATPISLTAADPGTSPVGLETTQFRVDGGPWVTYVGPFQLTSEGLHTVAYASVDRLGNTEAPGSVVVIVDDTPPATTVDVGEPRHVGFDSYVTSATPISLASLDGGLLPAGLGTFEYRVGGGPWVLYTAPISMTGPDGPRVVEYRATDRVGNQEPTKRVSLFLDNAMPSTRIFPASGSVLSGTAFTLAATDAGSGVASTEYRIDGGTWIPYGMSFVLPPGYHVIEFRSTDELGNREAVQELRTTVEVPAPPVPLPENWKPAIAAISGILLAVLGIGAAFRNPWRGVRGRRGRLLAFVVTSAPFVVAEWATGVASIQWRALPIPPVLGSGVAVDGAILAAGVAVAVLRALHLPVWPSARPR